MKNKEVNWTYVVIYHLAFVVGIVIIRCVFLDSVFTPYL